MIKKFVELPQRKKLSRGRPYHCFLRELECLKRLQGHKNFPKLIRYDEEDLTIFMDYCGKRFPFDGQPRPELIQQVYDIVNKLKETNIKFITQHSNPKSDVFPYNSIHIKEDVLKFIDYENSLPEGSDKIKYFTDRFIQTHRDQFNIEQFEHNFKNIILNGMALNQEKYKQNIVAIDNMASAPRWTLKHLLDEQEY